MNDIERITALLSRLSAPTRKISKSIKIALPPAVNRINELTNKLQPYFKQLKKTAYKITVAAQLWQTTMKEDLTIMAANGWYPNWYTFDYTPESKPDNVDDLMSCHLNKDWDEITSNILNLCPDRKHILENAFNLHKSGNYIAAIPLFLAQADGICCEELKSFLFTNNTTKEKVGELIESGKVEANMFTNVFLEPYKLKNLHGVGISKANRTFKNKAPNRHGIMHGHRKHLDYGTSINSLKCFSLLSFIVFSTKEVLNES